MDIDGSYAAPLLTLRCDLGNSRFAPIALGHDRMRLERLGLRLREGTVQDRDLAWIDAVFGGFWSSEARTGQTLVAADAGGPVAFAVSEAHIVRLPWIVEAPGAGLFGPFGVDPAYRGRGVGASLARLALGSLRARGFPYATLAAVNDDALRTWYERVLGAVPFEAVSPRPPRRYRATVLASGGGTNFQAVIDAAAAGTIDLEPVALVVNSTRAFARERAQQARIPVHIAVWNRRAEERNAYDARLLDLVERTEPELVLLLGWMHVLAPSFIARFSDILNIHPAFLPFEASADSVVVPDGTSIPAFRGRHAIADALAAGSAWYGATSHRVGVDVDRGEVLARRPLPLRERDETAALAALRATEHGVLLSAIRRWSYERLAGRPTEGSGRHSG